MCQLKSGRQLLQATALMLALLLLSACQTEIDSTPAATQPPGSATPPPPTEPPPAATAALPATHTPLPSPTMATAAPATSTAPAGPQPRPAGAIALLPAGPVVISQIHMLDGSNGWALGGATDTGDHVLRTTDGGQSWSDVTPPEPAPDPAGQATPAGGAFLDPSTAWAAYVSVDEGSSAASTTVWRTTDGGITWQPAGPLEVEFLGQDGSGPLLRFSGAQHGWLLTSAGAAGMHQYPVWLFQTADGGVSWQTAADPFGTSNLNSCGKNGLIFWGSSIGWATVDSCPVDAPRFYVTIDGGHNWDTVSLPPPVWAPSMFQDLFCGETAAPWLFSESSGHVLARCRPLDGSSTVNHLIYTTEDGGLTWRSNEAPAGQALFLDLQSGWAWNRTLYRTLDGGQSWEQMTDLNWDGQFSFVNGELGWAVARAGEDIALVRTADGGRTWEIMNPVVN